MVILRAEAGRASLLPRQYKNARRALQFREGRPRACAFSFAHRESPPFGSVPWERAYDGSTRFLPLLWHLRLATIPLSARLNVNNEEEIFNIILLQVKTSVAIILADNYGKWLFESGIISFFSQFFLFQWDSRSFFSTPSWRQLRPLFCEF